MKKTYHTFEQQKVSLSFSQAVSCKLFFDGLATGVFIFKYAASVKSWKTYLFQKIWDWGNSWCSTIRQEYMFFEKIQDKNSKSAFLNTYQIIFLVQISVNIIQPFFAIFSLNRAFKTITSNARITRGISIQ